MTNGEKYLKDGVDIREFVNKYADYYVDETVKRPVVIRDNLRKFLEEQAQPTLTEDERVILRNIDTNYYPTIKKMGRTLYLVDKEDMHQEIEYVFKDHLFQFIKERRRIFNRRIIERRIEMTNSEKYLKEGVSIEELADKLTKKIQSTEKYGFYDNFVNDILIKFFKAKDIPTLTEDERVILRNLKVEKYIFRDSYGDLLISETKPTKDEIRCGDLGYVFDIYNHLFQFIKEGEEYSIKELLEEKWQEHKRRNGKNLKRK